MNVPNERAEIKAGNHLSILLPVVDEVGAPQSLVGAIVRFWVGLTPESTGADVKIQKSTGAGISVSDHIATVYLVPGDTDNLSEMSYYMEAEVEFPGPAITTVMTGRLFVRRTMIR